MHHFRCNCTFDIGKLLLDMREIILANTNSDLRYQQAVKNEGNLVLGDMTEQIKKISAVMENLLRKWEKMIRNQINS